VFVECTNIGVSCAEAFGNDNKIGALPQLPKVELAGNSASAYGNNVATKATTMLYREGANRSIIELVPGQELLSVAVKLYDSHSSLIKGSEDIIEMIICPDSKDACTALSSSLPAVAQGFNSQTGLSNIQAAVECALTGRVRMSTMLFSIRVVGADHIDKISGRVLCNMCKKGQRMITHTSRGTWSCETCLPGTYSVEPLTGVCFECPSSATCVNGVPIFGASTAMGVIEMELAEGCSEDKIRDSLSIRIGIDVWQITSILAHVQQQQRSSQKIEFTFVSNTTQIADLTARLKSLGAELGDPEPLGPQLAAGEVWEEIEGQYLLRTCPSGHHVTASTAQQQRCLPCLEGHECVNTSCVTCTKCAPGFYKETVSAQACSGCPQNTYRTIPGATELAFCLSCPAAATTARTESISKNQCLCSNRMYSTKLADFTCMICPAGAVCSDGSCALATRNLQCAPGKEAIKGTWMRSTQNGHFLLFGCPVGHRLNNESGHDVQDCLQCPEGTYMLDPNDPSESCQACPMTATCPNRGPPVFEKAAAIEGSLSIVGDSSDVDDIVRSLAASLGVEASIIVLGDVSEARRGQLKLFFQIFADESTAEEILRRMDDGFMKTFTANLAEAGINATITPDLKPVTKEKKREGEVWKLENRKYVLKSCPVGFLLINSTIETQTCKECETGTYAISYDYGCDAKAKLCESRACLPCANGATCNRGSSPLWEHFLPKPLLLGSTVLPWVTVITGGTRRVLFCEQEDKACAPPLPGVKGMEAAQEDHVWEFDKTLLSFVLKSCPPGHQLINSSAGIFNPALQQCSVCGAAKYIIDRAAPCMDCPKGARCPDGAQFLPLAVGSVWEEVRASNGGIQKRLLQCPAGYALAREEAVALGDACIACDPGTYRLIPSTLADLESNSSAQCTICDPRATCKGLDIVEVHEGY
jgi:hypothetical protein